MIKNINQNKKSYLLCNIDEMYNQAVKKIPLIQSAIMKAIRLVKFMFFPLHLL